MFSQTFLLIFAFCLSTQAMARETVGTLSQTGNPLIQKADSSANPKEVERLKLLAQASNEGDLDKIMSLATPQELTVEMEKKYGKIAEGDAHLLKPGEAQRNFKVRIDIHVFDNPGPKNQHLEMVYPDPKNPGQMTTKVALGSAGTGIRSLLLKDRCFVAHRTPGANEKTIHGDTLVMPVYFRGKRVDGAGPDVEGSGDTYAIHGLLGDNYIKKLGEEASHGCFRVSREDAKVISDAVRAAGDGEAKICVH